MGTYPYNLFYKRAQNGTVAQTPALSHQPADNTMGPTIDNIITKVEDSLELPYVLVTTGKPYRTPTGPLPYQWRYGGICARLL